VLLRRERWRPCGPECRPCWPPYPRVVAIDEVPRIPATAHRGAHSSTRSGRGDWFLKMRMWWAVPTIVQGPPGTADGNGECYWATASARIHWRNA
jgi:hypothetical protein